MHRSVTQPLSCASFRIGLGQYRNGILPHTFLKVLFYHYVIMYPSSPILIIKATIVISPRVYVAGPGLRSRRVLSAPALRGFQCLGFKVCLCKGIHIRICTHTCIYTYICVYIYVILYTCVYKNICFLHMQVFG